MKKTVSLVLMLFIILSSLSSCAEDRSAEDILLSITNGIDDLPYGNLYLKSAEEGSAMHLPEASLISLYGEDAIGYEFTLIEDYAIYLCTKSPSEVAVFKCYTHSDTELIATMCLKRIDTLRILLEGTPYKDIPKIIIGINKFFIIFYGMKSIYCFIAYKSIDK